jgi:hypothetical protein
MALAATACAIASLAFAAAMRSSGPGWTLAAAALVLVVLAGRGGKQARIEVGARDDGTLEVRSATPADGVPVAAKVVFCSSWLIVLARGSSCMPIWPDSVPAATFRRLLALGRWAGPAQADARPGEPGDRKP